MHRSRSPQARRTSRPTSRRPAGSPTTSTTSRPTASTTRRCMRHRVPRRAATASTADGTSCGFPTRRSTTTTGSTSCSRPPVGDDTVPPTVTSTSPVAGGSLPNLSASVSAQFSEPMDPGTVNGTTVSMTDSGGNPVAAAVSYVAASHTAVLTPNSSLAADTEYTVTLHGGAGGLADLAGNPLASDYSWTFTTTRADHVHHLARCGRSWHPRHHRQQAHRDRHQVPGRRRRRDHRPALLQGPAQHRHARRPSLDVHRHAPRDRDVHLRDGQRLAAGRPRHPRVDHRQHHVRRVVLLTELLRLSICTSSSARS